MMHPIFNISISQCLRFSHFSFVWLATLCSDIDQMAGFSSLSPKMKNFIVAGGLSGFVIGVYFYTMRAVGSTDELQVAIDKFERTKGKNDSGTSTTNS